VTNLAKKLDVDGDIASSISAPRLSLADPALHDGAPVGARLQQDHLESALGVGHDRVATAEPAKFALPLRAAIILGGAASLWGVAIFGLARLIR
jgi:hypothetical protein